MTGAIIARIDGVIGPLGFERVGMTWNRRAQGFVDVIDLQVSKSHDACTLNIGVMNSAVYGLCWGTEPPTFVDEPSCVVRARIGELTEGTDIWWSLDGGEAKMASKIAEYALPFLERMHSLEAMEEYLTQIDVRKKKYPLPIIYLAIIKSLCGKMIDACAILADVNRSVVGPWRIRASEAAKRIGCR